MNNNDIDLTKVDSLSKLSAFHFSIEQKEMMKTQVSGIIDMLDECGRVESDNLDVDAIGITHLREDKIVPSMNRNDVIGVVPRRHKGYIVVPKVVD